MGDEKTPENSENDLLEPKAEPMDISASQEPILSQTESEKSVYKSTSSGNSTPKHDRDGNCYCGKERNLNIVELLCASCMRWFHESCIGYQLGKLVPFMMNYLFVCKNCSPTGLESFKKNQAPFPQMCITAIGNLMQANAKDGGTQTMFSKEKEIIPFIDSHWEGMTTMPRRVTQSWHGTIHRALAKETGTLFMCEELPLDGTHPTYGLMYPDLTNIRPNYEALIRGGHLKITDVGIQHDISNKENGTQIKSEPVQVKVEKVSDDEATNEDGLSDVSSENLSSYLDPDLSIVSNTSLSVYLNDEGGTYGSESSTPRKKCKKCRHRRKRVQSGFHSVPVSQFSGMRGRTAKRKLPSDQSTNFGRKGRGNDQAAPKMPSHGYPLEHPYNKDGYRYILAEPDPHAPYRQEFDESSDWAGKPIPGWLYRTLSPSSVLLALHDRAPQLKISEDRLAVTGDKGYCMVRATHAVSRGAWYWEATVEEMPDGAASRIGWAQEYANLQAPLGYDKFGYSWRSRKGTAFHECRGKHYTDAYAEGDTLGFLIVLPPSVHVKNIPNTYKDRPLVKFKSHLYYEEKDNLSEATKALTPLDGSKIIFFKNGVCQGEAFTEIYGGTYYPTVAVFKSTTISVNFGPNFKHPPDVKMEYRGLFEKAEEAICEQTLADLLYLTENDGKLRLDQYGS